MLTSVPLGDTTVVFCKTGYAEIWCHQRCFHVNVKKDIILLEIVIIVKVRNDYMAYRLSN